MNSRRARAKHDEERKEKRSTTELYDAALRHFHAGRFGPAEDRCARALAQDPRHADALHLLGLIYWKTDRLDFAAELVAAAIQCNSPNPKYLSDLGSILFAQNRFEEAERIFGQALDLDPDSAAIWVTVGDMLRAQGRHDEALATYDRALTLDSTNIEAANKTGVLLFELGRYEEALAKFDLAQAISPDQVDILYHRGDCLSHLDRRDEAIEQFEKAIRLKPDFISALNKLGTLLSKTKRLDDALSVFDRSLSLTPDRPELLNNRGIVLLELGRYDEALALFDRAISLNPEFVNAHSNRGICLDEMVRPDEALASYEKALALQPEFPDAHWNMATNRLRAGDYRTGWAKHEWRRKRPGGVVIDRRDFHRPLWLGGEPIRGKTLLLYSDQGFGDALQFCRYVPLLAAVGARVILEVPEALRELLAGLDGVSEIFAKGQPLPDFDFYCPLSSLPCAFDTTLETIPSVTPYISARGRAEFWKSRLASLNSPRIGLAWSGNPENTIDQKRSIPLQLLLPLLEVDARFVSLQKNVRPADRAILDQRKDILDLGPELENFADTAAVMSQLDLVISVDTSVSHLAGALGRPLWILLSYVPCWRYLLHRTDSPWYPTARLFRQSETREWPTLIDQVRAELSSSFIPSLRSASEVIRAGDGGRSSSVP